MTRARLWFLIRTSIRCLTKTPAYFGDGDGTLDSIANLAIALRHWPETLIYFACFGRLPNYLNPGRYSEKVQWHKLFDRNPDLVAFSDKLESKRIAAERAPEIRLPRLLWSGDDPDEIPFKDLSIPFVIKPNNSSGAVVMVRTAEDLDVESIRGICREWMRARPHHAIYLERAYALVRPKLFVEEFLSAPGESDSPPDLKVYPFHGKARYVYNGHVERKAHGLLTPEWDLAGYDRWQRFQTDKRMDYTTAMPRPEALETIIRAAEQIAAGIDHLRVDMYEVEGEVFFGETTVYPLSGHFAWIPHEAVCDPDPPLDIDRRVGELWKLPRVGKLTALKRGLIH